MSEAKSRPTRAALLPSLLTACGLLWTAAPAQAQGFDCRYAATPDEKLICRDPRLGRLDEELSSAYARQYYGTSGPARTRLDQQEDAWVVERRRCGADPACIEQTYRRRMEQLGSAARPAQSAIPQSQQGAVAQPQPGAVAQPQHGMVQPPHAVIAP